MGKTVIIVGAGFAGLAAAQTITSQGSDAVEAIILEGSHRVGGRANTQQVDGLGRVEFGATYFHGLKDHPLYTAACQHGLMDDVQSTELRWGFTRERQEDLLSKDQAQHAQAALRQFAAAVEASVAAGQKLEAAGKRNDGHGYTIGEHLTKVLEQEVSKLSQGDRQVLLQAWRWHELQLRINTAAPSSRHISTAWWGDYEELIGPNLPITCGFQTIAETVAEGLDIRYGHLVSCIEWGEEGVRVSCANGSSFQADAVIVTVSLGVLKAQPSSLFHPALPAAKAAAIDALGFGLCEKIFARWPVTDSDDCASSAHQQPCVSYQLLWDVPFPDAPPSQLAAALTQPAPAHNSSPAMGNDSSVAPSDYSSPAVGSESSVGASSAYGESLQLANGKHETVPWWATGLFSFRFGGSEFKPDRRRSNSSSKAAAQSNGSKSAVESSSFPEVKYTGQDGYIFGNSSGEVAHAAARHTPAGLPSSVETQECACLWLAGAHARAMDQASEQEVAQGIQSVLSTFPAIADGQHIGRSPRIWRSKWGLDPLFLGSYSYMTGACNSATVQSLVEPVAGKLYLAGEATDSKYMGTMHAAFVTGQAAAEALLKCHLHD